MAVITTLQTLQQVPPAEPTRQARIMRPYEGFASLDHALDHLKETVDHYHDWKDPLSLQLKRWGRAFEANRPQWRDAPKQTWDEFSLLFEILRNPIDGALLRSPYLTPDGIVWEEWMIREKIKLQRSSGQDLVEHEFAADMLEFAFRWYGQELSDEDLDIQETTLLIPLTNPRHKWERIGFYQAKIDAILATRDCAASNARAGALQNILIQPGEIIQNLNDRMGRLEESHARDHRDVLQTVADMGQNFETRIDEKQAEIADKQTQIDGLKKDVVDLRHEVKDLRNQVNNFRPVIIKKQPWWKFW